MLMGTAGSKSSNSNKRLKIADEQFAKNLAFFSFFCIP